jgi:hypothetical protein
MYSVEQFPDGTREAVLSVDGIVFKSRDDLDVLYPVRPIPGMDLRVYYHSADAVAGALFWEAWDDNECLAAADTAEILIQKVRMILVGRMLGLVSTYNALFRLDVPSGPAKLFL